MYHPSAASVPVLVVSAPLCAGLRVCACVVMRQKPREARDISAL